LSGASGVIVVKHIYPQISAAAYATILCVVAVASLLFFVGLGCYRNFPSDLRAQLPALFIGFSLPILLVTFILFSLKVGEEYSRGWILGWWGLGFFALTVDRFVAERVRTGLVDRHYLTEKYAIFGASENARPMIERLQRHRGIEIVGLFDDRRGRVPKHVAGIPVLGGIADLASTAQDNSVDRVVIALPITAIERIRGLVKALYPLPLIIDVGIDARYGEIAFRRGNKVADSLLLELFDCPLAEWRRLVKTCEDTILTTLLLIAFSPVFAAVAIAIKLDSRGPVLFRQKRYGYGGREFKALKFRTMHTSQCDELGEKLTQRNDARVTRVGRFLRRSSIDELPQLINVLRGEMSLVGPRPHPLSAKAADVPYHDVISQYALRHRVKPGITGWAQVNGWRGETNTLLQLKKRVEHDLFYIEHWSLWLDIQILCRTAYCVFLTQNTF
jgi:Undecaprenyl-phosphate glucose phosphotransferase